VRCRICRHADRAALEAASSDADASAIAGVATRFGVSELALERHLAQHGRGGVELVVDVDHQDEEPPATSRSPQPSGVILAARPDLGRIRDALVEALAGIDAIESERAREGAAA
jgi:hypothetical protein